MPNKTDVPETTSEQVAPVAAVASRRPNPIERIIRMRNAMADFYEAALQEVSGEQTDADTQDDQFVDTKAPLMSLKEVLDTIVVRRERIKAVPESPSLGDDALQALRQLFEEHMANIQKAVTGRVDDPCKCCPSEDTTCLNRQHHGEDRSGEATVAPVPTCGSVGACAPECPSSDECIENNLPDAKEGLRLLSGALAADSDFAWSWHCNLACMAMDAGAGLVRSNMAAANFMNSAFGVSVYELPQYQSIVGPYLRGKTLFKTAKSLGLISGQDGEWEGLGADERFNWMKLADVNS